MALDYSSKHAEENGLVLVPLAPDTWAVVAIVGTHGEGKASAWRGIIRAAGTYEQCVEVIDRMARGGR